MNYRGKKQLYGAKNRIGIYAGQYYDSETGLHYNRHRYYDPKLGRYLRPDPSHSIHPMGVSIPYFIPFLQKNPDEFNAFSYVQNNPINATDKYGLVSTICPCDHVFCLSYGLGLDLYLCFAKVFCNICGVDVPGLEPLGAFHLGETAIKIISECDRFIIAEGPIA